MKVFQVLALLVFVPCACAQQQISGSATSHGKCSPPITGSRNTIIVNCVDRQSRDDMAGLLQAIHDSSSAIQQIRDKVEELAKSQNELKAYGSPTHGELLAGHDADPEASCPPGTSVPNDFKIFLGDVEVRSATLPLVALETGTGDFIELVHMGNGIGVNALVTQYPGGKVIAKIANNEFVANSNNTLQRIVSTDRTSLLVEDEYNHVALSVKVVNPHAVRIEGQFSSKGGKVVIDAKKLTTPRHNVLAGACVNADASFPTNVASGLLIDE